MTQPGNIHFETFSGNENLEKKPRARPGTAGGERGRNKVKTNFDIKNENSKTNKNNQKCNYLFFNKYININHDLEMPSKKVNLKDILHL